MSRPLEKQSRLLTGVELAEQLGDMTRLDLPSLRADICRKIKIKDEGSERDVATETGAVNVNVSSVFGISPDGEAEVTEDHDRYSIVLRIIAEVKFIASLKPAEEEEVYLRSLYFLKAYLSDLKLSFRDIFPTIDEGFDRMVELISISATIDFYDKPLDAPDIFGTFSPGDKSRQAAIYANNSSVFWDSYKYAERHFGDRSGDCLSIVDAFQRDYPEIYDKFLAFAKKCLKLRFFSRVLECVKHNEIDSNGGNLLATVEVMASENLDCPKGLAGWMWHMCHEFGLTPRDVLGVSLSDIFGMASDRESLPSGFTKEYLDVFERMFARDYDPRTSDPELAEGYTEGMLFFNLHRLVLKNLCKKHGVIFLDNLNFKTRKPLNLGSLLARAEG